METQERTEREIDLIELFWKVLLGWRQIICIGIQIGRASCRERVCMFV